MLDLEQCPFCKGKLEIVTLNCSSGGTPCYCFRCTKCGGIRRFGTLNPADLCRECERNPEISKEMHDLLCDVLTDCDIADGMRAEITRVVKIWEEESE